MTRNEILGRYRHLRAISARHNSTAMKFLTRSTIMEQAKRLGLAHGQTLVADSEEEMVLVFDLAIYSAMEGRTTALDRYARAASPPPGSDEVLVLDAMRRARFSIWQRKQRHEAAGLVVTDLVRDADAWLMDENMESTAPDGMVFASRLYEPESFAMTSGVIVPVTPDVIEEVKLTAPALDRGEPDQVARNPRYAAAIYRAAIESGVMNRVAYR